MANGFGQGFGGTPPGGPPVPGPHTHVEADVTDLDHVPNVHDLAGAEHGADTLTNLNTKVSDATLDDASSARPPTAHTHVEADITDLAHTVVLVHKAGHELNAAFTGNPKKATVTLSGAFADANYAAVATVLTTGAAFGISIESQVAGSFVLNANANNIGGLVQVNWVAIKDGES